MAIQSFPFGIPFSSSFAISASYAQSALSTGSLTASVAEFITGYTGPSGRVAITVNNGGQFVFL